MDDNDYVSDAAQDLNQSLGSKAKSVAKGAGKAVGRAIKKVARKAVRWLVATVGPAIAGFLCIVLILGLAYMWLFETRGSSGQLSRDPAYQNPVVDVNGVPVAQAYTEPQALINSYYNYLSVISAQKVFVDPATGEQVWLKFDNNTQTSDYAGLTTTNNAEEQFYLSPYLLMMADEIMHQQMFYYPEQFIKPVFSRFLPVSDSTDGKLYITTLPLIDDGSKNAVELVKELSGGQGNPTAADTPYSASPSYRSYEDYYGASLSILSTSHPYSEMSSPSDGYSQTFSSQNMNQTVPGFWDYGLGTIIQYEVGTKDKYINCAFNSFTVHIHRLRDVPDIDPETGEQLVDPETNQPVMKQEFVCENEIATIVIDPEDTIASLMTKINALNTETERVVISPSTDELTSMLNASTNKIEMNLSEADLLSSQTVFNNTTLQRYFGKDNTVYPLNYPMISAVATFSGSLRYEYASKQVTTALETETMPFDSGFNDNCTDLEYFSGTAACGFFGSLTASRTGEVVTISPVGKSAAGAGSSVYADPLGMTYLEAYMSNYEVYVPNNTTTTLNRVKELQEGPYSAELDANNDGVVTVIDYIIKMGLMESYRDEFISQWTGWDLYKVNDFDISDAIEKMRHVSTAAEDDPFNSFLSNMFSGHLNDMLTSDNNTPVSGYESASYYIQYRYYPDERSIENIILQSRTFDNQSTYSQEAESFNADALVFYGFDAGSFSNGNGDYIVSVAQEQVGNVNGDPYWSWYGFDHRVAWCACFVSWCGNECGYLDEGVLPKFSAVSTGITWFQERDLWMDSSYIPDAGDIIFFDWEQDGGPDHVGIVEKVENGTIYTIEGNSGNECKEKSYAIDAEVIYGFGTPEY